jgi:tetratricopeptide (TPR) repeat protein
MNRKLSVEDKPLFHSRRSARHFLFSKTDIAGLPDDSLKSFGDTEKLLQSAFPDLLFLRAFKDHALNTLEAAERFAAVVIQPDSVDRKKTAASDPGADDGLVQMASILDTVCRAENGIWGGIESGKLAGFFPDKNGPQTFALIRGIQTEIADKTRQSVTVGIAAYPTISYARSDILTNAAKALDHAAFFGPDSAVIFDSVSLNISGDKHFERGDIAAAIKEFKTALELDPSNVNVHNSLGVCFGLQGEYDRAIEAFKTAISLEPGEYMALYNLGLAYLYTKKRERALEFFLKADKINDDAYEAAFQAGKLYLEEEDRETARKYLERAADLEPTSGAVHRYLGDCHAANNMSREAIAAYRKAIKLNPRDAAAMSALGCLFEAQGENPEITLVFCRESVGLAPDNALFRYRLGQLLLKQNRLKEALQEFRKAQDLGHDATDDINETEARLGKLAS